MRQGVLFFAGMATLLLIGHQMVGYGTMYRVTYAAVVIMAVLISLTYLWLYMVRATPLALGMSFSWSATAAVQAWWWFYTVLDSPPFMAQNPVLFVLLSLYITGAMLHFVVIQKSLRLPMTSRFLPVLLVTTILVLVASILF